MNEQLEKLELESLDIVEDRIESLKQLFPEAFKEGKVDFDSLKRSLGNWVDPGKERFGLNWAGKADCMKLIQQASAGTLLPMREESVNFDTSENLIIEGENLEVLKLLQKSYYGKVKMIYIDPPYNTGNEFIYPDNFHEGLSDYLKYSKQVDEKGFKHSTNTETDGRYHSKWLNMMYPRLFLARNLLREDGVIFISIDDHEVHNLRSLMNEIFGEENFLANIVWQKKYAATNDSKGFSNLHDHIIVYQKSDSFNRFLLPRTTEQDKPYKNDDGDGRGLWRSDNLLVKSYSESGVYPIINSHTGKEYWPTKGSCWRASKETMQVWLKENRIFFGKDNKGAPQLKRYLNEVQQGKVPTTWWTFQEVGHNDAANKELKAIFDMKTPFDTPKPSSLIKQMLRISTSKDDTILDFFAGSGTTAHAAIDLNKEDRGNRKFILVQLPEKTENPQFKTIADITRERVRRVINKQNNDNNLTNLGFKSYHLAASNFRPWQCDRYKIENIHQAIQNAVTHIDASRSAEDILYELLLKDGYSLTAPIEKLNLSGKEIFSVCQGELLICLDRNLTLEAIESMVELSPMKIICLDKGFKNNDQLKVNAVQTIKAHNHNSARSSIQFRVV